MKCHTGCSMRTSWRLLGEILVAVGHIRRTGGAGGEICLLAQDKKGQKRPFFHLKRIFFSKSKKREYQIANSSTSICIFWDPIELLVGTRCDSWFWPPLSYVVRFGVMLPMVRPKFPQNSKSQGVLELGESPGSKMGRGFSVASEITQLQPHLRKHPFSSFGGYEKSENLIWSPRKKIPKKNFFFCHFPLPVGI